MDNKYQNGKIYKLVCDKSPLVYYGSTIKPLSRRLTHHKVSKCCSSRELFKLGNVSIELVEEYPCNSKKELQERERIYIEFMLNNFNHKIICNKVIPGRTAEEWRIDNRDEISKKRKEHYKANRDNVNERSKKYYRANREKANERSREYHKANREKHNEQSKVYRIENRETINKKQREKFNCDCGGRYTRCHKARHMKSKNHLAYVSANSNNTE